MSGREWCTSCHGFVWPTTTDEHRCECGGATVRTPAGWECRGRVGDALVFVGPRVAECRVPGRPMIVATMPLRPDPMVVVAAYGPDNASERPNVQRADHDAVAVADAVARFAEMATP